MKIPSAILPAVFLAGALLQGPGLAEGRAAPLNQTTAVQTKPDPAAPIVTFLKAGSEPASAAGTAGDVPAGWMAVEVPGPFEGYVLNKDLTKNLEIRAGGAIYLAPTPEAGVLAVAAKGDKSEITGLHGRWTQVRFEKSIVGYIRIGPVPSAGQNSPVVAAGLASPAEPASVVAISNEPGKAAPDESGSAPRSFEGRFVSTRRLFRPIRPYDWELDSASGDRAAYLDIGKLLLTEHIGDYIGHDVVVFGTVKTMAGGKDIVIEAESLQLK
jgi:hypothetical protein